MHTYRYTFTHHARRPCPVQDGAGQLRLRVERAHHYARCGTAVTVTAAEPFSAAQRGSAGVESTATTIVAISAASASTSVVASTATGSAASMHQRKW